VPCDLKEKVPRGAIQDLFGMSIEAKNTEKETPGGKDLLGLERVPGMAPRRARNAA